jgi:hypothetical protein
MGTSPLRVREKTPDRRASEPREGTMERASKGPHLQKGISWTSLASDDGVFVPVFVRPKSDESAEELWLATADALEGGGFGIVYVADAD